MSRTRWGSVAAMLVALALAACAPSVRPSTPAGRPTVAAAAAVQHSSVIARRFAASAMGQVGKTVRYDSSYAELAYPAGDVPIDRGVCTDVVVRAAREVGVDLQVKVHEDMSRDFKAYPQRWDLPGPDANIDHRRVPNLQTYYQRQKKSLPVTKSGADYWPGDVVSWDVGGRPHIGVMSTQLAADGSRYLVAHNIGSGVHVSDDLFTFPITGHYRPF